MIDFLYLPSSGLNSAELVNSAALVQMAANSGVASPVMADLGVTYPIDLANPLPRFPRTATVRPILNWGDPLVPAIAAPQTLSPSLTAPATSLVISQIEEPSANNGSQDAIEAIETDTDTIDGAIENAIEGINPNPNPPNINAETIDRTLDDSIDGAIDGAIDGSSTNPNSRTNSSTNSSTTEPRTEAVDGTPVEGIGIPDLVLVDLQADRQEFDQRRQLMIAEGNAFLRFNGGAIVADRIQYNISTKFIRAEGNVKFRRGQQRISGDRLEYNLVQQRGQITPATGQLFNAASGQDLGFEAAPSQGLPSEDPTILFPENPPLLQPLRMGELLITTGFGTSFGISDATQANPENVVSTPLEISNFRQTGTIQHWRYEADSLDLVPDGWTADRARLTNDPFDPSQFRLRTHRLRYREITPLVSEVRADRPRYVFDNQLALPTFRNRVLLDRREQDAGLFGIGYDTADRGGLFIERSFEPLSNDRVRFTLTPQFLLQKALFDTETEADPQDPIAILNAFALTGTLQAQPRPGTTVIGEFVATDLGAIGTEQFEETFRGNLRMQQGLPLRHTLAFEASFRDRLFNGSLGYQTIHSSLGAVLYSPTFILGDSGITLRYQGGIQTVTADTDRADLLAPIRKNNRTTLSRYQGSLTLERGFTLWQGEPLPATPTLGLRYTPSPIIPSIRLNTSATGLYSVYSNGETQESITSSMGVVGTFGHHSRSWLDFTELNVTYSRAVRVGESPFLFDRIGDNQALGLGFRQQIYGPIVAGFQTGINLDTGEEFSRDYTLEYQRRAFNIALRYNPERELGTLTFRLYDFAW
ncbi:MAG: DUF3769 domain-containing protein [Prochlorothrix sp.]